MSLTIDPQKIYTVEELETLLGIHKLTIQRILREKKIRAKKVARRWFVTGEALQEYFASQ